MTTDGPRAGIVTIGEELLSGATVDSNAAWLGRALAALGVPVERRWTVGDRDADIVSTVRQAIGQVDVVLVTGGLGPTDDDRTRPALATALGMTLVEDPVLVSDLRARLEASGRGPSLSEGLRRLALRPAGGQFFRNPSGAAPGLLFPVQDRDTVVIALPGVPREMRALFPALAEEIVRRFALSLRLVLQRTIHTTGIPESELAPPTAAAIQSLAEPIDVAWLPDLTGVDIRLSVRHADSLEARAAAGALLDRAEAAVAPYVAGYRFEAASGDLVESVAEVLEARGWWLAAAESCTGGLVAQRWTARAGSSRTFRGGVVAYHNDVKEAALGVPRSVLDAEGAVSEAVARIMAESVRTRFEAECGIGITGVAGPGGGSDAKPVGTVWIAVSLPGSDGRPATDAIRFQFSGDREAVRIRAAQAALHLLLLGLDGVPAR